MEERTGGAFSLLSKPGIYSFFQRLLGSESARPRFVAEHLRPQPAERILDVGCGPADILDLLPDVHYVGIDANPSYIEAARQRYGERGEFHAMDVREASFPDRSFDLVSVVGLLHHLDDAGVEVVFRLAARVLVEGGRMVTLDNAIEPGQNRVARWVIERDRGAQVRSTERYAELARPFFEGVRATTREDLLRIPYTHAILECDGPRREAASTG
jgi:SAM-dependent methyltransferase